MVRHESLLFQELPVVATLRPGLLRTAGLVLQHLETSDLLRRAPLQRIVARKAFLELADLVHTTFVLSAVVIDQLVKTKIALCRH